MGFELFKEDAITPQRMYGILCLVRDLDSPGRSTVFSQVQPRELVDNHDAADRTYQAMRRCGFAVEDDSPQRRVSLLLPTTALNSIDSFRRYLQSVLIGVTEASRDHFVLNQFAAWYAVQDHNVLEYSNLDIELKFNERLYPDAETRAFRERKDYNGWRTWAEFLGWGWSTQAISRRGQQLIPDATIRLKPLLAELLGDTTTPVPFDVFMGRLASTCPELDGGDLFKECWQASRSSEDRGNRVSLMLSTALRTLHNLGYIELTNQSDAARPWTLFPAQSQLGRVSHIRRTGHL